MTLASRSERTAEKTREFLNLARDRYKQSAQAESTMRTDALDDLKFASGDQWPADIKADRQINRRPCLTVNVLPQFIRQVTNEQRQQRPAIVVNPVGNGADIETAEVIQGYCRHVEVLSDAEVVYDYEFEYGVKTGFGYWRLITDYTSDEGDEQDIFIRRIANPFCVYDDPNAQEPDRSDREYLFIVEDIPVSRFKEMYPKSAFAQGMASLEDYQSIGDSPAPWASTGAPLPTIRVAEYYHVEREGRKKKVEWAKITALDILDEEEVVFDQIPVVGVFGDDYIIDGKRFVSGLVRNAKDPQRAKNYWTSSSTEMIALAPKAPFIGPVGAFKTRQAQWEQANYRNFSYLEYDPVTAGGQPAEPPQRNSVEPPIQAMNAMLQLAQADLQSTTGLYPNSLGKQETANESGKAVLARQKQGDITTLNFSDNLARAIRQTGRIIVKAFPKVKTKAQLQRIIKPDQTVKHVGIFNSNEETQEEALTAINDPSITRAFDIGTGTYDVTVSVGPSYQTKRQEAAATQMALIQAEPQLLNYIGDLVVGNMDIPGSQEIAKRLKKLLPPGMDDEDGSQTQQIIAQHAQLTQQVQLLSQALQKAQMEIQTKQIEQHGKFQIAQMQSQSDQVIQKAKIDAQIAVAEIETKAQNAVERARMYMEVWNELHGSAHEMGMQKDQQGHEHQLAQMAAQQAQQQQQSEQGHELGMAGVDAALAPQNGDGNAGNSD